MTKLILKLFVRGRDESSVARSAYGSLAGAAGIICNLLLCGFKAAVGIMSGSISIIADAVNNLSDTASSVVTLAGFKLSKKPADKEHPFGHARIEYMSGAFISIVIIIVGCELMRTSVLRILNPMPVEFSFVSLVVLAVGILAKTWMRSFYAAISNRIGSPALAAAAKDSRNDAIMTAAVLMGAFANRFFGIAPDGYLGATLALFIIISGFISVKDTLDPLLGQPPPNELVARIYSDIMAYDSVLGLHDLIVHSYGPGMHFATVHVEMDARVDPIKSHGIIDNIEREIEAKLGIKLVIHYDPLAPPTKETAALEKKITELVISIDNRLSIHDLRTINAHDHTNIVFDIAVPPEYRGSTADLKSWVAAGITAMPGNYYPVIQLDQNYTDLHG